MALDLKDFSEKIKSQSNWLEGSLQGSVDCLYSDSRRLGEELGLFFARKGPIVDGHDFLKDLSSQPSIEAFVVERLPADFKTDKPILVVRDSSMAMALASKLLYRDPTADALSVAVTGTNGKTTSCFLISKLLEAMGRRPAISGTVKTSFENQEWESQLTTPDFSETQKNFSKLRAQGADSFVFEASSHALDQRRLLGLELDVAVFTNLTQEHLDYHSSMEAYYQAKKSLFSNVLRNSVKKRKIAVIGIDSSYGSRLVEELKLEKSLELWTWGESESARLRLCSWETELEGSKFEVEFEGEKQDFQTKLLGKHNIENCLVALSLGLSLGLSLQELQSLVPHFEAVPGRLEPVSAESQALVLVDYAHTPDALENVLTCLRPMAKNRLIVIFGCGGDRDREKRPKMAEVAELYADELVVTSDNPRTEDPQKIINEILQGLQRVKKVHVEPDRKKAIKLGIKDLKAGDIVLIAGKGHETYQILGDQRISFDDREVARQALEA